MSIFDYLPDIPMDVYFGMDALANADKHPETLNLTVGQYKDEHGNPVLFEYGSSSYIFCILIF